MRLRIELATIRDFHAQYSESALIALLRILAISALIREAKPLLLMMNVP
jgi:hypothetical protein